MKFVGLMLKNLWRNRLRTLLTVGSIAASLFLVTTLLGMVNTMLNPPETPDSALRLITRHKSSLMNTLPAAYGQKIANVEGVEAVSGSMWFGGMYNQDGQDQMISMFATETDQFFQVNPDMEISDDQAQAFLSERSNFIAGDSVADRFGWEVGGTYHFGSNLFSLNVELKLVGIYSGGGDNGGSAFFHWDYFDEGLNRPGFVGTYSVRVESPEQVPQVSQRIDAVFENSTTPTHTETEKDFILGFMSMLGNVQLLITSICLAVMFAVILIAANTVAMSIRERIREIGVMKALGFKRKQVMGLLIGESVLLCVLGTLLGSLGARVLFGNLNMQALSGGFLQSLSITPAILSLCLVMGILVGLIAAGFPAWQAAQRPVVQALRNIA